MKTLPVDDNGDIDYSLLDHDCKFRVLRLLSLGFAYKDIRKAIIDHDWRYMYGHLVDYWEKNGVSHVKNKRIAFLFHTKQISPH